MSTNKFTIELKADESNFSEIADSIRRLSAALRDSVPDIDAVKRGLESIKQTSEISSNFADINKHVELTADAMLDAERATKQTIRSVEELDDELNGARRTALSLADAIEKVDSASGLMSNSADRITTALNAISAEQDRARMDAGGQNENVSQLAESAFLLAAALKETGDSGESAGISFESLAVAGAAAGAAMVAIPLIMEGVTKAFEFATQAVAGYMSTTQEGRDTIAKIEFEIAKLKNTIGESVTDSQMFNDGIEALTTAIVALNENIGPAVETIDSLYTATMNVWEATEGAREAFAFLNDRLNPIQSTINSVTTAAGYLGEGILWTADAINEMSEDTAEAEQPVVRLTSAFTDFTTSIFHARNMTNTFSGAWNRALETLGFGREQLEAAQASVASFSAGGNSDAENQAELQRQKELDALIAQKDEQVRIELEASERIAEIADNARLKELQGIELQKEAERAALEAIELARVESAERQAEIQAAADEKRREETQAYLDLASEGYASLTTALVGSVEATATATSKAGAAVSKGIGDGLTALGASAKAAGAVKLFGDPATGFFPNPGAGIALITAGIAAEQIGKAMGGKQRGDQKAAPREVQAPVTPSGPSNNFYANVNMTGMVGNREELARTVVSALSTASRNGVI